MIEMKDMEEFRNEVAGMSFETAMEKLEGLVKELENGGADLDRSLEIYEAAVVLRNRCKEILEDGQRRIQKLVESADGIEAEDLPRERDPIVALRYPPPNPRCSNRAPWF